MEETLNTSPEDQQFSDRDIFTKIWLSPRQVFKFINDYQYDKYVIVLLVLAGVAKALERASSNYYGDTKEIWEIVVTCVVVGGIFGWITYYLFAGIISWTGKWMEGEGNTESILRIMSFAMLPSIMALLILLIKVVIYGDDVFRSPEETGTGLLMSLWSYFFDFIHVLLAFWSIFLFVIGISEVQKLSIGKSILNLLIASLVLILPIVLFAGLLALMM
jgi:hypothetical protein